MIYLHAPRALVLGEPQQSTSFFHSTAIAEQVSGVKEHQGLSSMKSLWMVRPNCRLDSYQRFHRRPQRRHRRQRVALRETSHMRKKVFCQKGCTKIATRICCCQACCQKPIILEGPPNLFTGRPCQVSAMMVSLIRSPVRIYLIDSGEPCCNREASFISC